MKRRKHESLRFENLFWSLRTQSGLLTYAKLIVLSWCSFSKSWGVATCKGLQDSLGFRIPRNEFRISGIGFRILSQWNVDSGFQSFVGLWIPWDLYSIFQSLGFRIPNVRGISDSLRCIFRVPKPRIPDSTTKVCWIPDSTSQNFPDSGIWNPLLGREVTLSGNLPTKQEYIPCSKLSWTIHWKIYWKKILILENDLIIVSNLRSVKSVESSTLWTPPFQSLPNLARFIHFPKMASASVQNKTVEDASVAKTWEMSLSVPTIWSHGFSIQKS